MKKYNIGFIGSGKMAGAIIKGLLKTGFVAPKNVLATQAETDGIIEKEQALGVKILLDNKALVEKSDVIFVAVKPNQVEEVLNEISDLISSEKLVVSIAAGVKIDKIESKLSLARVIRVMPNTPALVGEGMSAIVGGKNVQKEDLEYIYNLLSNIGKCIVLEDETQMDIVTAISGSGPAFFYKIMNDIARAGEKLGLDYEKALLLSVQTALGSAKMALNRDKTMEELVANVATKGGCTRVGVDVMEEANTQNLFLEIVQKTTEKACSLGN